MVKALVYVDAFIPDQGQKTVQGLLGAVPGWCIGGNPATTSLPVSYPDAPANSADLYLQPQEFPDCFTSGLPATQAAGQAATQRPPASAAVTEASDRPAWATIPSWAVVGTSDKVIPTAELLAMARHAHARVTTVNAGHAAGGTAHPRLRRYFRLLTAVPRPAARCGSIAPCPGHRLSSAPPARTNCP